MSQYPQQGQYPQNQYARPPGTYATVHPVAHPARSSASAAMWCSILGFVVPVVPSILGIVLGRSAKRRGYPGGRAHAAIVLGGIGLVLDVLAIAYQGVTSIFG